MNERIRELANEAENYANAILGGEFHDAYTEKFAELIVQDCERALHPMLRDMISRGKAVDLIRKHFGVDE